jgi:DNA-binding MarR family transcriptional regulator
MQAAADELSVGGIADKLKDDERRLLGLIQDVGAVTPAELAVKTFMLPEEANEVLNKLGEKGLISTQSVDSPNSPQLVSLTDLGLRVARLEFSKKMR